MAFKALVLANPIWTRVLFGVLLLEFLSAILVSILFLGLINRLISVDTLITYNMVARITTIGRWKKMKQGNNRNISLSVCSSARTTCIIVLFVVWIGRRNWTRVSTVVSIPVQLVWNKWRTKNWAHFFFLDEECKRIIWLCLYYYWKRSYHSVKTLTVSFSS